MLLDIAKCKKKEEMDTILDMFYSRKDLNPTCRYLRLATATAAELWTSRHLLSKEHNESWYSTDSVYILQYGTKPSYTTTNATQSELIAIRILLKGFKMYQISASVSFFEI